MANSTTHIYTPQRGQHLVMCLAHMQDDRQTGSTGKLQLCLKQLLLPFVIKSVDLEVQPDLTDSHRLLYSQLCFQQLQIRRPVLLEEDRVQPQCRVQACCIVAERQ